jgi:hypothetical protein
MAFHWADRSIGYWLLAIGYWLLAIEPRQFSDLSSVICDLSFRLLSPDIGLSIG